jgi:hypothetical protein
MLTDVGQAGTKDGISINVHCTNVKPIFCQTQCWWQLKSNEMEVLKMKFKDAPIGARFKFIGESLSKDVYVKINSHDNGLVVKWNGNVQGYQSHCCWLDEENSIDFNTEVELV